MTEKRVGIAVEADRVLREESEEVAHVRVLLDVNMIGHLRLSAVRNQNHQQRRREYLIKTTRKRRGESREIIHLAGIFSENLYVSIASTCASKTACRVCHVHARV